MSSWPPLCVVPSARCCWWRKEVNCSSSFLPPRLPPWLVARNCARTIRSRISCLIHWPSASAGVVISLAEIDGCSRERLTVRFWFSLATPSGSLHWKESVRRESHRWWPPMTKCHILSWTFPWPISEETCKVATRGTLILGAQRDLRQLVRNRSQKSSQRRCESENLPVSHRDEWFDFGRQSKTLYRSVWGWSALLPRSAYLPCALRKSSSPLGSTPRTNRDGWPFLRDGKIYLSQELLHDVGTLQLQQNLYFTSNGLFVLDVLQWNGLHC